MKRSELKIGFIYFDGKQGLREILALQEKEDTLTYRILSSRNEQEYSHKEQAMISIVGNTSIMGIASFASWAKFAFSPEDGQRKLLEIKASRISIPSGEKGFLQILKNECIEEDLRPGSVISLDKSELRAARGLIKKGLFITDEDSTEIEVTPLGAAWFRVQYSQDNE